MRRRFVEVLAIGIGAALVVFYYLDRQPAPSRIPVAESQSTPVLQPTVSAEPTAPQPVFPPVIETPDPVASVPATDDAPSIASAQAAWETARAEVETVRSDLERLDGRFDQKDAEFARLEAEGMDPEELEERMLIFLDGIVEEYDELEGRLSAAEAAEQAAADRLEALGGSRS